MTKSLCFISRKRPFVHLALALFLQRVSDFTEEEDFFAGFFGLCFFFGFFFFFFFLFHSVFSLVYCADYAENAEGDD